VVDTYHFWSGGQSVSSGNVGDNENSVLELFLTVEAGAMLSFWTRGGSEATYDFLHFRVDGGTTTSWHGSWDWVQHTEALPVGDVTLIWAFSKDANTTTGADAGWVDLVEITYP
jgi:hypothetical protein